MEHNTNDELINLDNCQEWRWQDARQQRIVNFRMLPPGFVQNFASPTRAPRN